VVDDQGNQLGVLPLQEALFKARQKNLDLVEVAGKAKPPVCKLINFKKFKYQEDKKQRQGKKGAKKQELKEVRFTPFIAKNDFVIRVKRAREFLKAGNKVRLTVRFLGRQITRKEFGYQLLTKANDALKDISKVESESKFQGRMLMMTLGPSGKNKVNKKES
jgi:translation initiation factor IF-3